jgi:hypothetical protein
MNYTFLKISTISRHYNHVVERNQSSKLSEAKPKAVLAPVPLLTTATLNMGETASMMASSTSELKYTPDHRSTMSQRVIRKVCCSN